MTSRSYCFTAWIEPKIPEDHYLLGYCIYGEETCPESKKKHWQGYIEFKQPIRMKQAKEIIGDNTAHLETRRGTREQARNYCMKDNDYLTFGNWEWQEQGKRTDLDQVKDDIKNGLDLASVAINNYKPFIKYHNGITKLYNLMQKPAIEEKKVYILTGEPGTGKSKYVYDNHNIESIYSKPNGLYWDGYYGQEVVLIDDIDRDDYKISDLLKWLDRYPVQVPVKGSFVYLKPKIIYITSNKLPIEWFSQISATHIQALERRVTKFIKFPLVETPHQ